MDDAAAQAVAAFRGIATGRAIVALMATSLCRLHRKGMVAIAEIIRKNWVEPILAGNYQLQLPAAIPARAETLCE